VKLRHIRVSPSFFSEKEAAAALRALHGRRLNDPLMEELVTQIWWLSRPTILPGWRWP
jgi:hypothetical protein